MKATPLGWPFLMASASNLMAVLGKEAAGRENVGDSIGVEASVERDRGRVLRVVESDRPAALEEERRTAVDVRIGHERSLSRTAVAVEC